MNKILFFKYIYQRGFLSVHAFCAGDRHRPVKCLTQLWPLFLTNPSDVRKTTRVPLQWVWDRKKKEKPKTCWPQHFTTDAEVIWKTTDELTCQRGRCAVDRHPMSSWWSPYHCECPTPWCTPSQRSEGTVLSGQIYQTNKQSQSKWLFWLFS